MSTIPTSLTENQFDEHVLPYLSVAKRGLVSTIPLYKVFSYILYRLHTGVSGINYPLTLIRSIQKRDELGSLRY